MQNNSRATRTYTCTYVNRLRSDVERVQLQGEISLTYIVATKRIIILRVRRRDFNGSDA